MIFQVDKDIIRIFLLTERNAPAYRFYKKLTDQNRLGLLNGGPFFVPLCEQD